MATSTYAKIAFAATLATGIGLTIAGIFVEPLLIPGITLLGGAAGFFKGAFVDCFKRPQTPAQPETEAAAPVVEVPPVTHEPEHNAPMNDSHDVTNVQNNMYFIYRDRSSDEESSHRRSNRLTLV